MIFLLPVACPQDPEIGCSREIPGSLGQAEGRRVSAIQIQPFTCFGVTHCE